MRQAVKDPEREDAAAKRVLDALKRKFGADKNVNLNQPFRMAGFNNKKQARNNFIVKIHSWSEKTDSRVRKAIDKLKPDMKVRAREVEPRKPKDSSVQRHRSVSGYFAEV